MSRDVESGFQPVLPELGLSRKKEKPRDSFRLTPAQFEQIRLAADHNQAFLRGQDAGESVGCGRCNSCSTGHADHCSNQENR